MVERSTRPMTTDEREALRRRTVPQVSPFGRSNPTSLLVESLLWGAVGMVPVLLARGVARETAEFSLNPRIDGVWTIVQHHSRARRPAGRFALDRRRESLPSALP